MGLIRKTLMVSALGGVSGSSKKQRVAKASLRELKQQTALLAQIADPEKAAREQAERIAATARREQRLANLKAHRQERRAARARQPAATPSWLVLAVRVLGWIWVGLFAIGSIGVVAKDGVSAVLVGVIFAGIPAVVLWKTRKTANPSNTAAVPASQEPSR